MGKQTDRFPLAFVLCASEVIFLSHAPSPTPQKGATLCFHVSPWNPGQSHGADAGFCLPVAAAVLRGSFRWRKWLIFHAFQLASQLAWDACPSSPAVTASPGWSSVPSQAVIPLRQGHPVGMAVCWAQCGTRARLLPPCRELPSVSDARHLQPSSGPLLGSSLVSAVAAVLSKVLFRTLGSGHPGLCGLCQGGRQPAVELASGCQRTPGRRGLDAAHGAGAGGAGPQAGHPGEGQAGSMCDSGQTGPASGLPRLPERTERERGSQLLTGS